MKVKHIVLPVFLILIGMFLVDFFSTLVAAGGCPHYVFPFLHIDFYQKPLRTRYADLGGLDVAATNTKDREMKR